MVNMTKGQNLFSLEHRIRRAFTLVELLVTIAIVGLISSVAVVASGNSREKARIAAGQSFSAQLDRVAGNGEGGRWLFNEGSGTTAVDALGGGHDGILLNGPVWSADTPSGAGYSLSLDGLNDYVQVTDYSGLKWVGGDLTLAVWIKPDPAETNGHFLSKPWNGSGGYNYILTYTSGGIYLSLNGATGYYSGEAARIAVGKWSFITATVDSAKNVKIYVDGSLRFSGTHTIAAWAPPSGDSNLPLAIGTIYPYGSGWAGLAGHAFQGLVDDPRVYNSALGAKAVEIMYAEGISSRLDLAKR